MYRAATWVEVAPETSAACATASSALALALFAAATVASLALTTVSSPPAASPAMVAAETTRSARAAIPASSPLPATMPVMVARVGLCHLQVSVGHRCLCKPGLGSGHFRLVYEVDCSGRASGIQKKPYLLQYLRHQDGPVRYIRRGTGVVIRHLLQVTTKVLKPRSRFSPGSATNSWLTVPSSETSRMPMLWLRSPSSDMSQPSSAVFSSGPAPQTWIERTSRRRPPWADHLHKGSPSITASRTIAVPEPPWLSA